MPVAYTAYDSDETSERAPVPQVHRDFTCLSRTQLITVTIAEIYLSVPLPRRCIETERAADATFDIAASMVEIYNEAVVDLLAEGGKREVELAKCAGGFAVPDLTRVGARPFITHPKPFGLGGKPARGGARQVRGRLRRARPHPRWCGRPFATSLDPTINNPERCCH